MIYASRYLRLTSPYMRGPDVLAVQQRLQELNIYQGSLDSIFGPLLNAAVRDFQRRSGQMVDGVAGPETYQALYPGYPGGQGSMKITVDIDNRILQVFRDYKLTKTYPVAVGAPATPTPLGDWTIVEKALDPGGAFGARWMRLSIPWGGYGIHGTNNPNSIGQAVSHGCVRMQNEDVIELYEIIPLGTPLKIIGAAFTGRVLRVGSQGNEVRSVQQRLQILGYYRGDIDGVFGPITEQAVRAFQKDQGLDPNGMVETITLNALQKTWDLIIGDTQP